MARTAAKQRGVAGAVRLALVFAAGGGVATAADSSPVGLEEVVVTAQFREQNLQ